MPTETVLEEAKRLLRRWDITYQTGTLPGSLEEDTRDFLARTYGMRGSETRENPYLPEEYKARLDGRMAP